MGTCGTVTLIVTLILALLCAIGVLIVSIVGLADPNHDAQWELHWWYASSDTSHKHRAPSGINRWRANLNEPFVIGIYCVFLLIMACIEILSCFLILIFRRNYIVRYILRFLRFVEGHGAFLMLLGIMAIGIAGDSGILVGAFTLCAGALIIIIALLLRCIDASAAWGEYKVYHLGSKK